MYNVNPKCIEEQCGNLTQTVAINAKPQINRINKDNSVEYLQVAGNNNPEIDYPVFMKSNLLLNKSKIILFGTGTTKTCIGVLNIEN
jgi:hypothetical protein